MMGKLLVVVAAGAMAGTSLVHAETWRVGLELIDQWSLFTCAPSLPDRYWDFTLEGSRLSASGPEGAQWTAQVGQGGSFKAVFTAYWYGRLIDAEITGNAEGRWALMHNKTALCWYRLEPIVMPQAEPSRTPAEWTSVSAPSHGPCREETLARVKELPGAIRMTLIDVSTQFAQLDIPLAADGSGKAEYQDRTGALTRIEIPPGVGKRALRSARLDGTCRWVWRPN